MKRIALLIYSAPFHFPPTINAANILCDMGHEVHLLGIDHNDDWSQQLNSKVKLVYLDKPQVGLKGILSFFRSILFVKKYLKKHSIDTLLGYDAKSVLPAFIATRGLPTKWFFHQHDFWDNPKSIWEKFIWLTETGLLRYATATSFPQIERSEFFLQAGRLKKKPQIVFNSPRKKWLDNKPTPNPIIAELRSRHENVLIYQGGWSVFFGLERIFAALALCKTSTALIMLGEEREAGVRDQYLQCIQELGLQKKVYLAEKYIPYEQLTGFTCYCDAAIAILTKDSDPAPFNNRYLIGASNKISEYVACGLPVMIQDSLPNRRFLEKYPIGVLIDSTDAAGFAASIDALLKDKEKRERISSYNKQLFLVELNFDEQFKKIADQV